MIQICYASQTSFSYSVLCFLVKAPSPLSNTREKTAKIIIYRLNIVHYLLGVKLDKSNARFNLIKTRQKDQIIFSMRSISLLYYTIFIDAPFTEFSFIPNWLHIIFIVNNNIKLQFAQQRVSVHHVCCYFLLLLMHSNIYGDIGYSCNTSEQMFVARLKNPSSLKTKSCAV